MEPVRGFVLYIIYCTAYALLIPVMTVLAVLGAILDWRRR